MTYIHSPSSRKTINNSPCPGISLLFFAFCRLLCFHSYLDYLVCGKPILVEVYGFQLLCSFSQYHEPQAPEVAFNLFLYSVVCCAQHWMSGHSHPQHHHHYCICEAAPATEEEYILDYPPCHSWFVSRGHIRADAGSCNHGWVLREDLGYNVFKNKFSNTSLFPLCIPCQSCVHFAGTSTRNISPF